MPQQIIDKTAKVSWNAGTRGKPLFQFTYTYGSIKYIDYVTADNIDRAEEIFEREFPNIDAWEILEMGFAYGE